MIIIRESETGLKLKFYSKTQSIGHELSLFWIKYQNNKQHLPTGQQMLNGVKATANFVEKNSGVIQGSEAPIVTGVKPQPKKNLFDPLANLFGIGKKETKPSTSNSSK